MEKKLIRAFKNVEDINPPSKLGNIIFKRIQLEKTKQIRRKLAFTYFGLAISILNLLFSGLTFGTAFLKSEFLNLVSLAFSDLLVVTRYWQEFSLSLLETFPTLNVIAILVPLGIMLWLFSIYVDLNKNINSKSRVKIKNVGNNLFKTI